MTFYLIPFQIFIFILLHHALLLLNIVGPIWTHCNELLQYTENNTVYRCWNKHDKKVFTKVYFNIFKIMIVTETQKRSCFHNYIFV